MKRGIVTGAFDLLHAGHIHLFRQARKQCDFLCVALQIDPSLERPEKNKPIESIVERQIKLRNCKYVDLVIVYETEQDLKIILAYFMPDMRFLGSDYKDGSKPITAKDIVPIEYLESLPIHTSDIRKKL